MEQDQHAELHLLCIVAFGVFNYFVRLTDHWWLFPSLIVSFFVNCDIDKLFDKETEKIKILLGSEGSLWHRNFLTHSALLSIAFYYSLRPFITFIFGTSLMWEFALWCFFPVIVHLFGDLKLSDIIETELKTLLKPNKKVELKEFGGLWQISLKPFSRKRLGRKGTLIWLVGNIIFMLAFVVFLYFFP
jgi:hypothetical protein